MAKVYESFEEGWRIPVGEYGNLVFENSHIVIYGKKLLKHQMLRQRISSETMIMTW